MAGVTNREFWDFRVKTRAQFTKLAEQIANIDTSGGGGISELTSKMVVDALGYTPYNAANPANYITSDALSPYAKTADVSTTYATIASVSTLQTTLEGAITKKADSATTLSGYGITDAYTKIDVDKLLEDNATKTWVNASLVNYATVNSVTTIKNTLTGQIGTVSTNLSTLQTTVSNQAEIILANEQGLEELRTTVGDLGDAIPTNNNQLDNGAGYITSAALTPYALTSQIPTTLPASDVYAWAKAATKPSYAWSEITSRPTALSQFADDVVVGKYLHSVRYSDTWNADSIYDAGIFSGKISNLPSGEPYGRILVLPYYNDKDNATQNFVAHLFITNGDDTITPNEMFFRTAQRNAWNAWNKVITDKNISNYNAGSATKLQTPRTLWGQSFDGTSGVNGHFVSTGENGGFALYSGIRYNEALSIERLSASGTWLGLGITLNLDGYVGIGTVYPSEKLEVNGNIKTNAITIGGVTLSWDSVNNALVVNGNMYGTGSITAKKSV